MNTMTDELAQLLERDKIRNCITRLARGEDRRDATIISSTLWPDFTADYGIFCGDFQDYIDWVVPGASQIPVTQHILGQSYIELENALARVETQVTAYHRVDTGDGHRDIMIGGRYLDYFEKRDGQWRIAARTMLYDWSQDVGVSADWARGMMGVPFSGDYFTGRAIADYSEAFFRPW